MTRISITLVFFVLLVSTATAPDKALITPSDFPDVRIEKGAARTGDRAGRAAHVSSATETARPAPARFGFL